MNTQQACINPLEEQRKQALEHYEQASKAICHWSGFVESAIKAYNPQQQPSRSAGVWVKASERKPTVAGNYYVRHRKFKDIWHLSKLLASVRLLKKEGAECHIEWLDESCTIESPRSAEECLRESYNKNIKPLLSNMPDFDEPNSNNGYKWIYEAMQAYASERETGEVWFKNLSDIRMLLLTHPDHEMILSSCLHYLGDEAQEWWKTKSKKGTLATTPPDAESKGECEKWCGMNYCDEYGCIERKGILTEPAEPTPPDAEGAEKVKNTCDIPGCDKIAPQNDIFCKDHRY